MNKYLSYFVATATAATVFAHVQDAQANCVPPAEYTASARENTVTACFDYGDCSEVILRQNTVTNEVVRVANSHCKVINSSGDPYGQRACFTDECVPAGTYYYGLADPLPCGCSTTKFHSSAVSVASDPDPSCEPSGTGEPPVPYEAGVPWGDDNDVCPAGDDDGLVCAMRGRTAHVVLGLDTAFMLAGFLTLVWRRRNRK
jgi:hypothetical protein